MKIYISFLDEIEKNSLQLLVLLFLERVVGTVGQAKLKRYFSECKRPCELPTNGCSWEKWVEEREPILKKGLDGLPDSPEEIANFVLYNFFLATKEKRVEVDPTETSGKWSLRLKVKDQFITLNLLTSESVGLPS